METSSEEKQLATGETMVIAVIVVILAARVFELAFALFDTSGDIGGFSGITRSLTMLVATGLLLWRTYQGRMVSRVLLLCLAGFEGLIMTGSSILTLLAVGHVLPSEYSSFGEMQIYGWIALAMGLLLLAGVLLLLFSPSAKLFLNRNRT